MQAVQGKQGRGPNFSYLREKTVVGLSLRHGMAAGALEIECPGLAP